jgi:predicted hydrocarbon binding protein
MMQNGSGVLSIGSATILSLRGLLGDQAAPLLQEAGYASGTAMYQAFQKWLEERSGVADPAELDVSYLGPMVSEFFGHTGWGSIHVQQLGTLLAFDTTEWAEVGDDRTAAGPSCHLTTGLLAAFLTQLAGDVVAVIQVECLTCGDPQCRFLAGSPNALEEVFEASARGTHYGELLQV